MLRANGADLQQTSVILCVLAPRGFNFNPHRGKTFSKLPFRSLLWVNDSKHHCYSSVFRPAGDAVYAKTLWEGGTG